MDEDPPEPDPVGDASDYHDADMMEAIAESEATRVIIPRFARFPEHLFWVREHIEREGDSEYLKGEVKRMQILVDEFGQFYDSAVKHLKTPMAVGAMTIVCRSLDDIQRIIDIAFQELNMRD